MRIFIDDKTISKVDSAVTFLHCKSTMVAHCHTCNFFLYSIDQKMYLQQIQTNYTLLGLVFECKQIFWFLVDPQCKKNWKPTNQKNPKPPGKNSKRTPPHLIWKTSNSTTRFSGDTEGQIYRVTSFLGLIVYCFQLIFAVCFPADDLGIFNNISITLV